MMKNESILGKSLSSVHEPPKKKSSIASKFMQSLTLTRRRVRPPRIGSNRESRHSLADSAKATKGVFLSSTSVQTFKSNEATLPRQNGGRKKRNTRRKKHPSQVEEDLQKYGFTIIQNEENKNIPLPPSPNKTFASHQSSEFDLSSLPEDEEPKEYEEGKLVPDLPGVYFTSTPSLHREASFEKLVHSLNQFDIKTPIRERRDFSSFDSSESEDNNPDL